MAARTDYQDGLATLAAGGTTVTFTSGANITAADIQPGDTFHAQNLVGIVATVTDATHIELVAPWTGTALAAASYRLRYQPDGSRFTAALRDLVAAISGGSVAALQALTGAADTIPYFTAAGVMALTDFGANARSTLANAKAWTTSLFGLVMAADKLPYGTGSGTMALADFTAAGRALLDDANASAQLDTLGFSAYIKTLIDDANAAAAFATLGNSGSFGNPGYWILPNGLKIQWGNIVLVQGTPGAGLTVTYPSAFTTYAIPVFVNADTNAYAFTPQGFRAGLTNQFTIFFPGGAAGSIRISWIAIGI